MKNAGAERLPWLSRVAHQASLEDLRASLRGRYAFLRNGMPQELAILGAGVEGKRLAASCAAQGIAIAGVYDNDATKRGTLVGRLRVMPSDAIGLLRRTVPVVIASHRVLGATVSLRAMGFEVVPFAALQLVEPGLFPPHTFHDDLLADICANRSRYLELAEMLEDEQSVAVLDRLLGYRLTMDATLLADCIDWDLYGSSLLRLGDDEVYVDGGAFDGDSVRMFLQRVNGKYERVLAFEPDPDTFGRLTRNLNALPRVELFNCGLHRAEAKVGFTEDGSRGAVISADAKSTIAVVGLDEVLDGKRASFIKLNIEGAEQEALRGAAKAIAAWRPKLAISVYHRPNDLWEIPRLIKELASGYRLYLRQHDGGIIESVLYAFA
jgi:FkbM family methyltransferase